MMVLMMIACLLLTGEAQRGSETATVSGGVFDAQTGRPLEGIWVTLAMPSQELRQTRTGADGRYQFPGLVPGSLTVRASAGEHRATYLPAGFSTSNSPPAVITSITVRPGEIRDGVDIRLWRARAISGRVVDESGAPLSGAELRVFRASGGPAATWPHRSSIIRTDDLGRFRIFGLAPGRYVVCAGFDLPVRFNEQVVRPLLRRPVMTCYPSADRERLATPVSVERADVDGVEIRAPRYPTVTISGVILAADDFPPQNAQVMLSTSWRGGGRGQGWTVPAGGHFSIGDVAPGKYVLSASLGGPDRTGDAAGEIQYAELDLDIVEGDVEGIELVLKRAATVKGRLLFDGAPPPPGAGVWRISAHGSTGASSLSGSNRMIAADVDGRFELRNLAGRQVVDVSSPSGWIVESIRWRGQEITNLPMEFDDRPGELEVTVSNRPALLTGRVFDEAGNSVTAGRVVLVRADKARWRPGSLLPVPISKDGRFAALPQRAGDYLVVALSLDDSQRLGDDPPYELVESIAERLTLLENDRRSIDLRMASLPEWK